MFLEKYLPQIKISQSDKREYNNFINSKSQFGGKRVFIYHVINIFVQYIKLSKKQKESSYIYVYYDCADFPILTIGYD